MSDNKEKDELSGVETTGHEWDGIKELNNPLPRWWLWCFYMTIVFAIGYTIAYPAWPGLTGNTQGVLGWSSRGDVAQELQQSNDARAVLATELANTPLEEVAGNADLYQFAVAGGSSAFKVNCSQCHGAGAAGGGIYPNLVDDDWIWGGTLEDIHLTLRHGIRYAGDDDTRDSLMPAFGDGLLEREEISDVAWFVRQISSQETDVEAAKRGEVIFDEQCAVCHGAAGGGDREFGAPKLNDAIWLYGGAHNEIVAQIVAPKQGVMPSWSDRLSDVTLRQLSVYVHSLGGGEVAAAAE